MLVKSKLDNARNNVAGIRPTPAYKDIVYTESVNS